MESISECQAFSSHTSRATASGIEQREEILHRIEVIYPLLTEVAIALEHAQLYRALRKSEERYRHLFEEVPVGLYRTTPEGQILDANSSLVQILGYPNRQTLMAINVVQGYVNAEERQRWQALIEREGSASGFEAQWRRHDGTVIWVRENARAIRDDKGQVLHYEGAVEDITERKQAEETLRESEQRYRGTLDSMLEGFQIVGFDWRYLYVNDAIARHGRRAEEELLGHTMMEMYPGIEDTEMFAALRRCMEKRTPHRMENEFTFSDGAKGWFDLSIQPALEGIFILSLDITDRKLLQEEREPPAASFPVLEIGCHRGTGSRLRARDQQSPHRRHRILRTALRAASRSGDKKRLRENPPGWQKSAEGR